MKVFWEDLILAPVKGMTLLNASHRRRCYFENVDWSLKLSSCKLRVMNMSKRKWVKVQTLFRFLLATADPSQLRDFFAELVIWTGKYNHFNLPFSKSKYKEHFRWTMTTIKYSQLQNYNANTIGVQPGERGRTSLSTNDEGAKNCAENLQTSPVPTSQQRKWDLGSWWY